MPKPKRPSKRVRHVTLRPSQTLGPEVILEMVNYSRSSNSNLPQFPSAAVGWPPQIPPEWLQLMQSTMQGSPMPPPLPGLNFPPPSLPHTPQAPATPVAFPPQYAPQLPSAPAPPSVSNTHMDRVKEVTDSDREDGEVSDADGGSTAPPGIAMRQRYPEPPRSVSQASPAVLRVEDAYNPEQPSAGHATRQPAAKDVTQGATPVAEGNLVQQQREEVKQFIRLLNAHNIGYQTLAKENVDVELLRGMYRSMNLPSEPEPIPLPKPNGAIAVAAKSQTPATAPGVSQKTVPPVATNIVTVQSAAPSPVDRKDYLARLQAAKLARQSGPAKASPPQKSSLEVVSSPATGHTTPQTTTPTRKPPVTDEQKARQTELIKQRLEALKAQSKQNTATSTTASKPGPSQNATQQPRAPGANVSAPHTPAASFTGIPGLFMNSTAGTINGSSTPTKQAQAVPQKRPAPSDTSVSTPRGSVTPYNRPFGQSPHLHQEDSMIIEVSDDESHGSDMDIDDDQAPSGSSGIRQAPVSIPGFPPRQAPMPTSASAVSTPGPQTPATLARTGELSTKEQELAALKLTLKKKLAEQKRIKEEAATAAASAAATQVNASQAAPSKPTVTTPVSALPSHTAAAKQAQPTPSQSDSSRDRKRRRRTEIQEQLPTLDDEIANNEAEMARLAKDLEKLKANNERIMLDKQRLTKELEDLGIDTEGMSHADMKATKDEIERAKSPEVDNLPKSVGTPSQGSVLDKEPSVAAPGSRDKPSVTTIASVDSDINQSQYGYLPGLGQGASKMLGQPTQEPLSSLSSELLPSSDLTKPREAPIDDRVGNDRTSATPMDDEEDFYSPPPLAEDENNVNNPLAHPPSVGHGNANAPSPSEEGEIEMSESSEEEVEEEEEEEEYEPEEPVVGEPILETPSLDDTAVDLRVAAHSPQQDRLLEPQVEQPQSLGQSQVSTEDEEAYEPPDVDDEMTEAPAEVVVAQPVDAQSEVSSSDDVDEGAMDIATSSSDESDDSESESDEESQSELGDSSPSRHAVESNTNVADDLAPESQPQNSVVIVPAAEQSHNVAVIEEPEPKPPKFTPYESPLRLFKSYRYHPNFSQDIDGGFLSMTYSHQIDPEKPLCPFESAGGSCNDPECPNQHFRGMGITGEKLLVQLGTANPGKTQEEKQQWNDGLRSVLKDLRQQNIKDPNGIAREIAKYRRQFLNDDTRVVNL
ncbi:hypothetical protein E8E13_010283 [Curvularia kusanoi]|uniref:Putative zinc-finger domain-containing protein n=1 Tax=Curvularia kusanoi TaxID=90978 RepID=A0A9P4TP24_CURKU|nr:hypothetical protein E8E13_010283 [Curvularia kusanoi]